MITSVAAFVVALILATPRKIEGFALARRKWKVHSVNTRKFHTETVILKSSGTTSIETPATINSQRSLNRIQSKTVKALMISYIASMCAALPA